MSATATARKLAPLALPEPRVAATQLHFPGIKPPGRAHTATGEHDSQHNLCGIVSMFRKLGDDMARRRGQRTGYLIQKGPSWILRWREDVRSYDGQPARHAFKRAICPATLTRKEAERIAWEQILSKLDQTTQYPGSLLTLHEFVAGPFAARIRAKKPAGQAHYRYLLGKHVLPALGTMRLRDVTLDDVQRLLDAKLAAGYSIQTAAHIRNCVSALFRHAKRRRLFHGDLPSEGVELPEASRAERPSLTFDQARALIAAIPRDTPRLLVLLLSITGLRIGEALGLQWADFDALGEIITVRRNYARKRGKLDTRPLDKRYGSTKTEAAARRVPILPAVARQLARLQHATKWNRPGDPVFSGRTGRPLDESNTLARHVKPAAIALGLAWVSWHSFRHTNASLADQAGLTNTELLRVLGHTSDRMTRLYSHADLEHVRDRLNELAARLLEPVQLKLLQ